jgi:stearoyl-CoA desaturase (delta-9 desaturase)
MEMTSPIERRSARQARAEEPMPAGEKTRTETFLVKLLAVVPLLALIAAMPFA